MFVRLSPWAVIAVLAALTGAILVVWSPWHEPGQQEWIDVNEPMAKLLAEEEIHAVAEAAVSPPAVPPAEASPKEPEKSPEPEEPSPADSIIDINRANSSEFDTLPGIGAKKAGAIVAYRNENGPFRTIEDIMNVKGIGEKMFAKMKHRLTIGNVAKPQK